MTENQPDSITELRLPLVDDLHMHLREGDALARTLTDAARYCNRLVAMPNLRAPLTTVARAKAYQKQLQQAMQGLPTEPEIMIPLYLTDRTDEAEILKAAQLPWICGAKLYPAGATTLSDSGVTDPDALDGILAAMEKADLPLLVHAETADPQLDIFDREAHFTDSWLEPWSLRFPALRMVVEHISSAHAAAFVAAARPGVAATITAHHLWLNRNDLLAGGIRPHHYCLPVAKRESDRQAVLKAATSGTERFFLGTDSAPHSRPGKETACGCAGIYTAHAAMELYAEAFERVGRLSSLRAFACEYGARFYRLPVATEQPGATLLLEKKSWRIPDELPFAEGSLVPFRAGQTLKWKTRRV